MAYGARQEIMDRQLEANTKSSPVAGGDCVCDNAGIHKNLHFAFYYSKMHREADVSRRTPRKPGFSPRHKSVLGLGGIIYPAKEDIAGCNIQENLSPSRLRFFLTQ